MKHRWLVIGCVAIVVCTAVWVLSSRFGEARTLALGSSTSTESSLKITGQLGGGITALAAQGDYAYVGSGQRLAVYRISSPNHPVLIWQSHILADSIADIALTGSYALVAARNDDLYIFDTTRPDALWQISHYALPSASSVNAVAVQGATAYLGSWDGMHIVDVSNPAQPLELGLYPSSIGYGVSAIKLAGQAAYVLTPGHGLEIVNVANSTAPLEIGEYLTNTLTSLDVAGNYAYVTAGGNGLHIIDVSTPAAPVDIASYTASGYAQKVLVLGNTAYLAGGNLNLLDISAPAAPQLVSSTNISAHYLAMSNGSLLTATPYEGNLRVINLANAAHPYAITQAGSVGYFQDVVVNGQYAYLSDPSLGRLHVVSALNPSAPAIVSSLSVGTYPSQMFIAGRFVYLTTWDGLKIVDIANPAAPFERGTYYTYTLSLRDVFVQDHYAYLADSGNGLRIVDVSNPSAPALVGLFNTPNSATHVTVIGTHAYVADDPGLRIVDVSNPAAPLLAGAYYTNTYINAIVSAPPYVYLGTGSGLIVLDATNPGAPSEIGSHPFPANNILKDNQLLYLGNWYSLQTVDVSNPISLTASQYYPLPATVNALAISGEYLYLATGQMGLLSARVADQAAAQILSTGGMLESSSDHTSYTFPAGAFTTTVEVRHMALRVNEIPPLNNLIGAGHYFETTALRLYTDQAVQPLQPYTLTITYATSELGAAAENTLALYYWTGQQWVKEPTGILNQSSHTLTATPQVIGLWAVAGSAVRQIHLPIVLRDAAHRTDLSIAGVEVTQAIQDTSNSVPLVANRPTMLRVYARASGTPAVDDVYLSVNASRNGAPLNDSPLQLGPWAVFSQSTRGVLAASFNAALPAAWLSGQVNLEIKLDVTQAVMEADETNNVTALQATFNPVPPLRIKIVPINYTHTPSGQFFPAPTADLLGDYVLRSYPVNTVNVSLRAPINFSGNLSNGSEWSRLLRAVTDVKNGDGAAAAEVYYGFIPTTNPDGDMYNPAWGGMGWIGQRASIGLNSAIDAQDVYAIEGNGHLAAHEIGHNFGLPHAPCGNAGGPDPAYPYPNASIGHYGFDTLQNRIWSPDAPDFTKDVMSYCGPSWFSDYNYEKLYANQVAKGALAQDKLTDNLYIRVAFDEAGAPHLKPVYTFAGAPTDLPAASPYQIELLDAQGHVVAAYPVAVWEAEEHGVAAHAIHALLPRPAADLAVLRLTRSGTPLLEQALRPPAVPQTSVLRPTSAGAELHWSEPDIPALIRYTADEGQTWTTVEFDALGGVMSIDPTQWPADGGAFQVISADIQ
jgi:hypothetical protein